MKAKVTREMLVAAHAVSIERSGIVIGADLLERIYVAMREREPAPRVSWCCNVCGASVDIAANECLSCAESSAKNHGIEV